MSRSRRLDCTFYSVVLLLAAVAWLTIFVLVRDSTNLEQANEARREGYSEGAVAQAVFKRGPYLGFAVFRGKVSQPTKIVLGVTGLDHTQQYSWHVVPGGGAACIDGRYSPFARNEVERYVDLTAQHGLLTPVSRSRNAGTSSLVTRVVYDRRLRFSGPQSVVGATLILRALNERLHGSLCANVNLVNDDVNVVVEQTARQPVAHGVCIFDVDMTLTCGGDCHSAECEFADPIARETCVDIAVTSGYRNGYPLRFNTHGTRAALEWCAARGFVPAIATHGNRAEIEHVGNCSMSKMEYVKRLLGIGDVVVCQDVREAITTGTSSRCVYGGSAWSATGGQVDKVTKDHHVQVILRSFVAHTQDHEQLGHSEVVAAAGGFKVMFFDDGVANQQDVLSKNGSYNVHSSVDSITGGLRGGRDELAFDAVHVRTTFPNTNTAASSGSWGNPSSCGLVGGDLRGLGSAVTDGWMLQANP